MWRLCSGCVPLRLEPMVLPMLGKYFIILAQGTEILILHYIIIQ